MNTTDRADPLASARSRFLRDGDEAAMAEIVRETRSRLLAAARRIGDAQDAEDAVQSAYLSLVRHRGSTLDVPLFPWLLTATLRIAYRHKALNRRESRLADLLAREARWDRGPLADAMSAEDAGLLRREVDRLAAPYRDVVVLHYLQGLSTAETALLLETTDAAVRKRLERARDLLRGGRLRRLAWTAAAVPWGVAELYRRLAPARATLIWGGTMKTSAAVVGMATAVVVGTLLGMTAFPRRVGASDDVAAESLRRDVASLRAEIAEKDAKLRAAEEGAARAPRTRASTETAGADAAPSNDVVVSTKPAAEESGTSPAVATGATDEALRRVDWRVVGEHMHAMLAALRDASRAVERHEMPPLDTESKLNEHAESLFGALAKLGRDVPGASVMSVFTNPAVLANVIAAALDAGKLPLTADQTAAVAKLAQRFADDDAARLARYDAHTFELRKVVDEADLRARFIASALETLTPEQRDLVSPASMRDRMNGDMVSTSLLWKEHSDALAFADAADFSIKVVDALARAAGVRDDQRTELRVAVERWTATLPPAWFDGSPSVLDTHGSPRISVTADLARREVEFLESLPTALRLDAAEAERVRALAATWRLTRTK